MASTSTSEDDAHIWGQLLVRLPENLAANSTDEEKAVFKKIIPLYGPRFTIGRAYDCKYQLIKKTVSNYHCYITKDGEKVLLFDTSANGTVINKTTKITNGQNYLLQDNDEIYLMRQKGNPYEDFCLIYQSILDLPNGSTSKEDTQYDEPVKKKIKLELPDVEETCSNPCDNFTEKVESQDDNLHDTDEYMSDEDVHVRVKPGDTKHLTSKSQGQHMDLNHSFSTSNQSRLATNVAPDTIGRNNDFCQSTSLAEISNTSTPVKTCVVEESVTNQLKAKDIPVSISLLDNNNENQGNSRVPRLEKKSVDGIEETLQCSLCIELLHEPVCLQPCLHCYCSGCYSQWMKKSKQCPQCRRYVESLSKNHIVSNLVDAFLNSHPDKRRSASDIEKLNEANSIKSDIVKFQKDDQLENASDNSSTDGYHDDDDDDDDDNDDGDMFFSGIPIGVAIPFQNFRSNVSCRQCPNSLKKGSDNSKKIKTVQKTVASNSQPTCSTPSTSKTVDSKTKGESSKEEKESEQQNASTDFVCRTNQVHIPCHCCQELMPDRRADKSQQCSICSSTFCHLYFGCNKSGCEGCLNQFKDLKFNDLDLLRGVGNNVIESRILLDFLSSNGKTWKTCFEECMTALDAGRFQTMPACKSTSLICNSCGLRQLKTLLYTFRKNIPKALLPNEVTSRPDCYWGKNCRTQGHKMNHAERFNHICEQSRFRP